MCSSASSDPAVPRGHEDPGGGEGGDPLQVLWSSAHQLHLAEVQETSETHTHTHPLLFKVQAPAGRNSVVFMSVVNAAFTPIKSFRYLTVGSPSQILQSVICAH